MLHVEFKRKYKVILSQFLHVSCQLKKAPICYSVLLVIIILSLLWEGSMSFVNFKKYPCHYIAFEGQEPPKLSLHFYAY